MSDTLNLANSIWPNGMKVDSDGHAVFYPLGTKKVQVPTSSSKWPKGDKLISPFVYQDDKLVGFLDTKALTTDSQTTIYLPYEHIEANFSAINKGQLQIHAPNATIKKASWKDSGEEDIPEVEFKYKGCTTVDNVKSVDANYQTTDIVNGVWLEPLWDLEQGRYMFEDCTNLTTFNGDLPSLTDGYSMFYICTALNSFTSDLSSLTNGGKMFSDCYKLTTFSSDLSNLTNGGEMFNSCTNLTTFYSDLSSLTYGNSMFSGCSNLTSFSSYLSSLSSSSNMFVNCDNLTSFTSDLVNLTNGDGMFFNCTNLTSFSGDLSSLTNGDNMFYGCKLDTTSVQNIANTINTVSGWYQISIGIGNSSPNEQEEAAFNTIASKGWTVYVNGSSFGSSCCATCCASLTTLDETGQEVTTPIPFWAKPVPSDEQHAHYVDPEGNFYNILGAQFIYGDNLETYGMFTSLENAATQMRLKKIGEEEIETA